MAAAEALLGLSEDKCIIYSSYDSKPNINLPRKG